MWNPRWKKLFLTVGQTRSTQELRTVKIHFCVPFLVKKTVLGMSNFSSETGVSGYLCHMTSWIQFVICAHFGT